MVGFCGPSLIYIRNTKTGTLPENYFFKEEQLLWVRVSVRFTVGLVSGLRGGGGNPRFPAPNELT